VATRLAHDGFAVVVNYAGNAANAAAVGAEIQAAGAQAIGVQADVATPADVARLPSQNAVYASYPFAVFLRVPLTCVSS
jgi:NAD(P)-dependent dehydrogenase (short-subunit alcohol dehydrogenase family)